MPLNTFLLFLQVGETQVGLIPSRELEERRAAFVPPEADVAHSIGKWIFGYSSKHLRKLAFYIIFLILNCLGICGTRIARKKKNIPYTAKQNAEFDRAELMLYEEVTRMPPFRRKTLVIVGMSGIARRTLKNRLVNSDPHKFGAVLPSKNYPQN